MQFTSIPFFLFLLAVFVLYYVLPQRFRNVLLLLASYYFYFSIQPEYLVLLLGSTAVNYLLGRGLETHREHRNALLGVGLLVNLGVLFFFKYFNFFGEQLNLAFTAWSLPLALPTHSLLLPIGISFYTFMALGYLLDVFWGDLKSQKNYLVFSLYLGFFPYILSGPICRAKEMFRQLTCNHPAEYESFVMGFRLILWGLFKKMVVADNIAVYVNAVYGNIPQHSSLTLVITALLYPLQLFADFSGYSDIARGVARLFGFKIMVNFKAPYTNSMTVGDYWKRNHISLTSWLRDYVFYPFMGSSTSKYKMHLGIMIMFLASGLWHGSSWMLLIWGAIQAFYLILEDLLQISSKSISGKVWQFLAKIRTYLFISASLIFFRLPDLGAVADYLKGILAHTWSPYIGTERLVPPLLVSIPIIVLLDYLMNQKQFDQYLAGFRLVPRWVVYAGLIFVVILFGNLNGSSFIYYEF